MAGKEIRTRIAAVVALASLVGAGCNSSERESVSPSTTTLTATTTELSPSSPTTSPPTTFSADKPTCDYSNKMLVRGGLWPHLQDYLGKNGEIKQKLGWDKIVADVDSWKKSFPDNTIFAVDADVASTVKPPAQARREAVVLLETAQKRLGLPFCNENGENVNTEVYLGQDGAATIQVFATTTTSRSVRYTS